MLKEVPLREGKECRFGDWHRKANEGIEGIQFAVFLENRRGTGERIRLLIFSFQ